MKLSDYNFTSVACEKNDSSKQHAQVFSRYTRVPVVTLDQYTMGVYGQDEADVKETCECLV